MGKSGLAALELLAEKGARLRATDVKPLAELPGVAELGVPFASSRPKFSLTPDIVVISPGVPCDLKPLEEARLRGRRGHWRRSNWLATFSRGRSSASPAPTARPRLRAWPATSCGSAAFRPGGRQHRHAAGLDGPHSRAGQWNVLELSSFQLETIQYFRARIRRLPQRPRPIIWTVTTVSRYMRPLSAVCSKPSRPATSPSSSRRRDLGELRASHLAQARWFSSSRAFSPERGWKTGAFCSTGSG